MAAGLRCPVCGMLSSLEGVTCRSETMSQACGAVVDLHPSIRDTSGLTASPGHCAVNAGGLLTGIFGREEVDVRVMCTIPLCFLKYRNKASQEILDCITEFCHFLGFLCGYLFRLLFAWISVCLSAFFVMMVCVPVTCFSSVFLSPSSLSAFFFFGSAGNLT